MIKDIKHKIENIIHERGDTKPSRLTQMINTLSVCYGGVISLHDYLYKIGVLKTKILSCKVISVGNLCAGGTGKTPMTLYIAQLLHRLGFRVCVISRGYKGGSEKKGGIVSDGRAILMSAQEAGDEPFMMANTLHDIPILVGQDRYRSGMMAINQFNADVILLDDGFQHKKLSRDIDLVLLDRTRPFGNGRLLPGGPLREPADALTRSQAVIFTRSDKMEEDPSKAIVEVQARLNDQPIFNTRHRPYISKIINTSQSREVSDHLTDMALLKGKGVVAFSGIAENENFKKTIEKIPSNILEFAGFSDHHAYSMGDVRKICQTAVEVKPDFIVTTEKDYVKLSKSVNWPYPLCVIGIKIDFGKDAQPFEQFLVSHLTSETRQLKE